MTRKDKSTGKQSASEVALIAQGLEVLDFPGHLFRVLDTRTAECYAAQTPRPDVTPRQVGVLLALFRAGTVSQARLSEIIRIDRNTLSEMITRMVQRGLIERLPSSEDRRAFDLTITAQGKDLLLELLPHMIQAQQAVLRPLPVEYHQIFLKCLRHLAEHTEPTPLN